jgi:hypothetical protein
MPLEPYEERVRALCSRFPEAAERLSHGHPTWFAGKGRAFCSFHPGHHGDPRTTVWLPMPPGAQEALTQSQPRAFFRPPYVGPSGWVGVGLDEVEWDEVEALVGEAYRHVASPRQLRMLG